MTEEQMKKKKERAREMGLAKRVHGMTNSKPYFCWRNMLNRCNYKKGRHYRFYGSRGIRVCGRWNSFVNFWEDMSPGYEDGLTLERIDVDGNYQKNNCCWIPKNKQMMNIRTTKKLTVDGVTKSLVVWSTEKNINKNTLWSRIYLYGWSDSEAVLTPVTQKFKKKYSLQ